MLNDASMYFTDTSKERMCSFDAKRQILKERKSGINFAIRYTYKITSHSLMKQQKATYVYFIMKFPVAMYFYNFLFDTSENIDAVNQCMK